MENGLASKGLYACLEGVSALIAGPILEPLFHPKPAAVTRVEGHEDKDVLDFGIHVSILSRSMLVSCTAREEKLAAGLRVYKESLKKLGIHRNIAVGTMLLMLPLAAALGASDRLLSVRELARLASRIAVESGPATTRMYYEILSMVRPSHLRRYRGYVPAVGDKGPFPAFREVLRAASWDLIHSELLEGYKRTLSIAERLGDRPLSPRELEERALMELLRLLASHGDTLILAKWGMRAYTRAKLEARAALSLAEKVGVYEAIDWLDSLWRPRRWNPGAALDIIAAAVGLHFYNLMSTAGL
jgi:triphosphoribosyl-dephospho-CoA synthetase